MPEGFWVKTGVSQIFSKITNFYLKTSLSGWSQVQDAWVKTSTTTWSKFFSALMAPSQDVEIAGTYGGYNNEILQLRGKNYVWSPTPQSLRYYFRAVNSDGTTYIGSGGGNGATASNTISYYPSSTTYLTVAPNGGNFKLGGVTKYFFEVRATGASGTVYSSLSADTGTSFAPVIYSPLAPTLTLQSSTSTSATITITAAADTTGTWGFSSWAATYRYIVYTVDAVDGRKTSGGGRGGYPYTTTSVTLTNLVAGRQYTVYVLPITGNLGSNPDPYNASTNTGGYSGYPGVEAFISVTTASPPTILSNPTFTLISGSANTVGSAYRLSSGTWNGGPTEYRYEIGRNNIAGTVIATFPSTTTWTTQTYYDHTFTATTGTDTVYGSVIARNANGESSPATASTSIGPIVANPQSTGQQRRVNLPSNFTSGTTIYVSTNGYIGIGTDPSGLVSLPTSGLYLSPLQGDQRQTALWTYSDASNFYVRWQGARYNDAAQTIDYQAKFYWNSTAVDVYFVTNNLSSSNPANTTAVYNNGSQIVNWSASTSQTSSLISTGIMTRNTSQDGVDDNRTAITPSAPSAPQAPTGVFASNITSSGARINWSAPLSDGGSPIIRYEVNRDTFSFFSVGNVFLYDYTLSQGSYTIGVRAVNAIGTGPASTINVVIPAAATKLATPTGISASTNRSDGISISWNNVANAATYGIWWGGTPGYDSNPDFGGPNNNGGKIITGSPFLDDGVTAGTTRSYYVQAFPTSGSTSFLKSDWSGGASGTRLAAPVKLATPTGVNATDTRTDGVNITWNAVPGAAYYGIWWGGAPGYDSLADFGGNRNTTLITGTSYLDTAITAGTTRDYYVQAYRSGDPVGTKSDWGGPDAGTRANVTVPIPLTPTGVNTSGSGLVTWVASSGASSYTVEYYTAQNASGTGAAGPFYGNVGAVTSFQIPYAAPNNWARARVNAANISGTSAYSAFSPASGYV